MRRGLASVVLAAFAVLTPLSTAQAATHQITIAQYSYMPPEMTVRVGDVITWTNQDQAPHDVAAGPFRSPMLETGQSWSYTFTQPGTFDYVCSIHPDMRARVTVLAAQTTQPVVQQPARTTTTTTEAVPTSQPTTSAVAATVVPQQQPAGLNPMLLLAGLVAAVTTLGLLLIGSRPD